MLISSFIISAMLIVNASCPVDAAFDLPAIPSIELSDQSVVFRSTQKLSSNDGRELYFYTNGMCDGYYGDRREFSCKYRLQDGEVRLLDEDGNTVYKGSYRMKSDRRNLSTVTIAGTVYWAR